MRLAKARQRTLVARDLFGLERLVLVVLLILSALDWKAKGQNIAAPQVISVARPATLDGHPALSFSVCRSAPSSITLTTRKGEEAFRFPVMHIHNGARRRLCRGYLYVTPTQVGYDAAGAQKESDRADAFQFAKSDVTVKVRPAYGEAFEVDTPRRPYRFWLGVDGVETDDRMADCNRDAVWEWAEKAFQDFAQARSEFAARTQIPAAATAQTLPVTSGLPVAQSPAPSWEEGQKTIAAFKTTADAWRNAGSRIELPEEADRHRILAENAFSEKDVDRALKHFKTAIEIYPTWPQGQFNLAVLCGETKDYECAYVHMKEYLLLVPDAPDARTAYEKTVVWEDKLNPK